MLLGVLPIPSISAVQTAAGGGKHAGDPHLVFHFHFEKVSSPPLTPPMSFFLSGGGLVASDSDMR